MNTWIIEAASSIHAGNVAAHRHYSAQATDEDLKTYAAWVAAAMDRCIYIGRIATVGGDVIGGAGATIIEWGPTRGDPSPFRARLVNVYTHPSWRGRGIATALCTKVIEAVQSRNIKTLSLSSTTDSIRIYEQLGFRPYLTEMLLKL